MRRWHSILAPLFLGFLAASSFALAFGATPTRSAVRDGASIEPAASSSTQRPSADEVRLALDVLLRYLAGAEHAGELDRGLDESLAEAERLSATSAAKHEGTVPRPAQAPTVVRRVSALEVAETTGLKASPGGEEGIVFGMHGISRSSTQGSAGVVGEAQGVGDVIGVMGRTHGPHGAGGVFENTAGGDILRGTLGGEVVFKVQKDGGVIAPTFQGDGSSLLNVPVGAHDHAGVYVAVGGDVLLGDDNALDQSDLRAVLDDDYGPGDLEAHRAAFLRWYRQDLPVGTEPYGVVFDGANIWVSNRGSDNVTKLRASDGANLGTFEAVPLPEAMAFDGTHIWVASGAGGYGVTKLRASDGAFVSFFGVDAKGLAFDGAYLWITRRDFGAVVKLAIGGELEDQFSVGTEPAGIAFDGANIWVANQESDSVTKLRASDGFELSTFDLNTPPQGDHPGPRGVAFDGAHVWVTHANTGVTRIRATDGQSLQFMVQNDPFAIAFDGTNVWVVNTGSNTVTKLRASDGVNLGSIPVGIAPKGIAFDGTNIWVANSGSDTVTKLPLP